MDSTFEKRSRPPPNFQISFQEGFLFLSLHAKSCGPGGTGP